MTRRRYCLKAHARGCPPRRRQTIIMQNVAVVALALLESASAFQAPAMKADQGGRRVHVLGGRHWRAPAAGRVRPAPHRDPRHAPLRDHGDQARPRRHAWLPPRDRPPRGRPGACRPRRTSSSRTCRRAAASLETVPTAGWLQIMVLTCMQEAGTSFASKAQTDDAEAVTSPSTRGCATTTPGQDLQAQRGAPERRRARHHRLPRAPRRRRPLPDRHGRRRPADHLLAPPFLVGWLLSRGRTLWSGVCQAPRRSPAAG